MDKENVVYIHNGMLVSLYKKEIPSPVTTWINLEDMILSEMSHAQRDTT